MFKRVLTDGAWGPWTEVVNGEDIDLSGNTEYRLSNTISTTFESFLNIAKAPIDTLYSENKIDGKQYAIAYAEIVKTSLAVSSSYDINKPESLKKLDIMTQQLETEKNRTALVLSEKEYKATQKTQLSTSVVDNRLIHGIRETGNMIGQALLNGLQVDQGHFNNFYGLINTLVNTSLTTTSVTTSGLTIDTRIPTTQ
jgi:hypothetical protein